jgi:hypothetical protein
MAYQSHQKPPGYQVVRTPAPDEISEIRNPKGGAGYGQNSGSGNPSSINPGKTVESALAANLRQSSDDGDNVLAQVIAKGVAGRGDNVPADGNDQLRTVSAESYPATFGMSRQQSDYGKIGSASLPAKTGATLDDSAARRAMSLKR